MVAPAFEFFWQCDLRAHWRRRSKNVGATWPSNAMQKTMRLKLSVKVIGNCGGPWRASSAARRPPGYRVISDGDGSAYREFGDGTRGKRRRVARLS